MTAPENTLAAFRQAFADGADAVELDVRLSRDGEAMVFHDRLLDRTSDGHGKIGNATVAELKELSAGAWYRQKFAAERIPTLSDVLGILPPSAGVNIEIKWDRRRGSSSDVVERCCELVLRHRMAGRALISSFNPRYLARVRALTSTIPTGLLYPPFRHTVRSSVALALSVGAAYLILNGSQIRRRLVEAAHGRGILIGEYTVNIPGRLDRALRFRDDAIFTDVPSAIRSLIQKKSPRR